MPNTSEMLSFKWAKNPGYIDNMKRRRATAIAESNHALDRANQIGAFLAGATRVVAVISDVPVFSSSILHDILSLPHHYSTFRYYPRNRKRFSYFSGRTFYTGTYDGTIDDGETPRQDPDSQTISMISLGNKYYFLLHKRYDRSPQIRYKFLCLLGTTKRFSISRKREALIFVTRKIAWNNLDGLHAPDRSVW